MKLDKDFIILFIGRIMQALLGLASIRILTSLLSKDEVGLTYVATSIVTYFSLVLINPIGMYLNRHIHKWFGAGELRAALGRLNIYVLLVAIISIPIVFFVKKMGVAPGFDSIQLILLIASTIYFSTWFQTLCPSLNMLEQRRVFVGLNLLAQVVGIGVAFFLISFFQKTAYFWMLGLLIGQSLSAVIAWKVFDKYLLNTVEKESEEAIVFDYSRIFHFCWPIAVTTGFIWIQTQFYRMLVEQKIGASAVAVIAVGLGIAASFSGLVESIVNQYFYPRYYASLSKSDEKERAQAWQILFSHSIAVYIPVSIFIFVCSKSLVALLVHKQFSDSTEMVMWGVLIEFFRVTVNIIYAVSQSEMKTKNTMVPYGAGAVALLLAVFFTNMKIPIVLCISGLVTGVLMYHAMRKILRIYLTWMFMIKCLLFSAPMGLAFFAWPFLNTMVSHLVFCSIIGVYLLFAIWKLQHSLYLNKASVGNL